MLKEVEDDIIYQQGTISIEDRFVPPTLILNPSNESKIMKDEIFGPILPIIEYDDVDEIISTIKKSKSGLTMYYYGENDTDTYLRLLNET